MKWPNLEAAKKVSEALKPLSDGQFPHEIMRLEESVSFIAFDIDGVDYGIALLKIGKQRARPTRQ